MVVSTRQTKQLQAFLASLGDVTDIEAVHAKHAFTKVKDAINRGADIDYSYRFTPAESQLPLYHLLIYLHEKKRRQ